MANTQPNEAEHSDQNTSPKGTRKSSGFFETTQFKPNWLDTGPLAPPPPPQAHEEEAEEATADESSEIKRIEEQIAELERLYAEQDGDPDLTAEPESVPETPTAAVDSVAIDEAQGQTDEAPEPVTGADQSEPEIQDEVTLMVSGDPIDEPNPPSSFLVMGTSTAEDLAVESAESTSSTPTDSFIEDLQTAPLAEAIVAADPDEFIIDDPTFKPEAEINSAIESHQHAKHKLFDRRSWVLLLIGLSLLGLALLIFFFNPFNRLALSTASLARPVNSPNLPAPATISGTWCLSGGFLSVGESLPRLVDTGQQGDIISGDKIFSLDYVPEQTGHFQWQVVSCQDESLAYPVAQSWIHFANSDNPVTFQFDSGERKDPLFFAIPFAVSAFDDTDHFRAIGSFQGWDPEDSSTILQPLGSGLYQQVIRFRRPGNHEAYIIAGSPERAIDAYGRTEDPIPFAFQTNSPDEYVVFLLDTNRGRASVLYAMPAIFTQMAFGNGNLVISALFALAGLAFLGWLIWRLRVKGRESNWLEAGCPQCGRHELMRVSRQPSDRVRHALGVPAYRYQCRSCTWRGVKLSEEGATISPGARITLTSVLL